MADLRIRLDAAFFEDFNARLRKQRKDSVVQSGSFDAAAAVDEKAFFAVARNGLAEALKLILAEINGNGVAPSEI